MSLDKKQNNVENKIDKKYLTILFIAIKNLIDLSYRLLGKDNENFKSELYEEVIKKYNNSINKNVMDIRILIDSLFKYIYAMILENKELLKKMEDIKKNIFDIIIQNGYMIYDISLYNDLLRIILSDIGIVGYSYKNNLNYLYDIIKNGKLEIVADLLLFIGGHSLDNINLKIVNVLHSIFCKKQSLFDRTQSMYFIINEPFVDNNKKISDILNDILNDKKESLHKHISNIF